MKVKKITLRQTIIAVSAIIATITGSIFFILYSNQFIDSKDANITTSSNNSIVLSPKSFGSYGELMFAYIGENNYIYNLDDESKPLCEQPASILLYASDDTVLFTASAETDNTHFGRESIIQELQIGEHENTLHTIATVSIDPCWSSNDEVIYFVKDENKKQLCTFEPLTSTTEMAAEFENEITGLRISSDGLLVTCDNGEEKLYVPLSKQLTETYYNCQGSRILVCEQYDLILSPEGILYYRWLGSNEAVKVAEHVIVTQGYQDNQIFFIQQTDEGMSLNDYFVSEEETKELAKIPDNILPQLTVSADYAFVIDDTYVIHKYDIDTHEFYPFSVVKEDVLNPLISVFDYRVMIYDLSKEIDESFSYAINATVIPSDDEMEQINDYIGKKSEEINPDYAEYSTLQMGSIGGDVVTLQTNLLNLGYSTTEPSGIFDVHTTIAVQYLQNDLGLNVSGVADGELQCILSNTDVSKCEQYSPLSSSSTGIRVRDIQARLKSLSYYSSAITGTIDDKTERALSGFSEQNGFEYSGGVISSELVKGLLDNTAIDNHNRIELCNGECSIAVLALNNRLNELGYLKGSVNPYFNEKTLSALRLFETVNNVSMSDECTVELVDLIFSENALLCPNELSPEDYGDSSSSTPNQVISDRQLKIIRKWLTKQFAVNHTDRQAVKRLQQQLVKLGYLTSDKVTMIYDSATMVAITNFQKSNEIKSDGIASKSTLTEIFSSTINEKVEEN